MINFVSINQIIKYLIILSASQKISTLIFLPSAISRAKILPGGTSFYRQTFLLLCKKNPRSGRGRCCIFPGWRPAPAAACARPSVWVPPAGGSPLPTSRHCQDSPPAKKAVRRALSLSSRFGRPAL